jgi:outer membrane protein OmpA-like peptidoglycan-associated protein
MTRTFPVRTLLTCGVSAVLSVAAPARAAHAQAAPKADAKIWDNYDFIPGSKVLFYTDFSEDKVGNFARGLRYVGGQLDVVERDGMKMLRSTARSTLLIPVGRTLPQRFTLEIDVLSPPDPCCGYDLVAFEGGRDLDRGDESVEVNWNPDGTTLIGSGKGAESELKHTEAMQAQLLGKVAHIRLLMDSGYFKLYTNERRMYNIPELNFRRDSLIRVFVNGNADDNIAVFITSIRVAESETDVLYDALSAKGRWATQGILFATGRADLKPESRPVLKEIASTLKEHGDLRVLIEGHTDNVGAAAANLALSEARAAAVKAVLVADFSIDASRVNTKGFGDTKPVAPNATATGRAQNRRVEIVKQ